MTFSAVQIKFDKGYLNELTSESDSGVFKQPFKYHIALHPAQLNTFGRSIKDELDKKIARYDDTFQGLMLGYENIKLQSELGVIGIDNCYIHVDIHAQFYIFRPEIGMMLKGKVTRTTKDHVGCLVYNMFNISLPKPPDEDNDWLGDSVRKNSQVEFKITYVDLTARLPHIRGELMSIILTEGAEAESSITPTKVKKNKKKDHSTSEEVQNDNDREASQSERKGKKIRFPSIDESSLHTELIIKEDLEDETPQLKTKKKHKVKHAAVESEINPDSDEIPKTTKKSGKKAKKDKHRHKEDLEDVSLESLDINSLFSNSSLQFDATPSQNQTTADSSEKTKRRRSRSMSHQDHLNLDNIKLEADSDLDNILNEKN